MATQKEIAARAGLSRATVSRAFADPGGVSPKSLQRINAALERLGLAHLSPPQPASAFTQRYVLVMANDISGHFFAPVIRGICDRLQSSGIHAVVCNSRGKKELEEEQLLLAQANRYLGAILLTAADKEALSTLLRTVTIPVVMVNRYLPAAETDVVCIDNYMGGYVAANYLMEKGHTRIGHIAALQNSIPQEDRIRGFRDALRTFQPNDHHNVYYGENSVERGYRLAEELLRQGMPHTALFVSDYIIAIGLVNALRDRGCRIPEDLSILCFDDSPHISEVGLNLSTLCYDPDRLGHAAVNTLLRRLGNPSDQKQHVLLVPRLIERASVLPPRQRP